MSVQLSGPTIRRCGLAAVAVGVASLVLAPLNALARMLTESGRSDLESELAAWWAEPALRVLTPWLLDFADPDTVYLTYGKFYFVALLGILACIVACRSLRPRPMRWTERWGWRLTITGYSVVALGQLAFYWWQLGDGAFAVVLVGMLIGVPASVLLGIGLLRGGFRPRTAAWITLLDLPLSLLLVEVSTMALGMWPMMAAWGLIGWSLARGQQSRSLDDAPVAATA